ncbi:hypothetical protein ACF1BP_32755 [Streptomyces sp. NPDC014735]|uniref:hypothetical protein n=1 Tax=unclassified Streptomyces TaxID=2593676 RepID=UPI0036F9BB9F
MGGPVDEMACAAAGLMQLGFSDPGSAGRAAGAVDGSTLIVGIGEHNEKRPSSWPHGS